MVLDYVALVIGLVGILLALYTFIYIHDIPYEIAKKNNHPQTEAIHIGCLLSLFTLHALWPLMFLWAKAKPNPIRISVLEMEKSLAEIEILRRKVEALESKLGATPNA